LEFERVMTEREDVSEAQNETFVADQDAQSSELGQEVSKADELIVANQEAIEPEIVAADIDLNALWVVRRLRAKGFEAYLTGGCVRDLLLKKRPKDFDVATNAKPEEVRRIFRNCRLIGRRFLLAHIFFPGGKIVETATFRANPVDVAEDVPASEDLLVTQDNVYGDIQQDAIRRDLTINGLFYDPVGGKVIDYVGGRKDLEAGLIRTIGEPEIRFREDPVRILRAVKFASRFGFAIEENTLAAMRRHVGEISRCAPARIQEEFVRLLTSGQAKSAFSLCLDLGILDALMPELVEGLKMDLEVKTSEPGQTVPGVSPAARWTYWQSLLGALDAVVGKEADVPSAVAFSLLLLPGYMAIEKSTQNERNWIDKLCVTWAERVRLTRHDQDRIRLLLSTVHLFQNEKNEQKSVQHVVRKPWFREALLLYILQLFAEGKSLEKVAIWKAMAEEIDKPYKQILRGQRPARLRFRRKFSPSRLQQRKQLYF
jgi:poly(A) polymerase